MKTTMALLLYRVEAHLAHITLNRSEKRNALNGDLIAALQDALARSADDPEVRVVVVRGEGKDFCAGLDLKELDKGNAATLEQHEATARNYAAILLAIRRHPRPVIAALRGRALGGGAGIVTACDLVLAAESSAIGYPEIKVGFVPATVSALLKGVVPEKRLFDLFAGGENLSAAKAHALGLISRILPDAEFDAAVNACAADLAGKSATALSLTKRLLYEMDGMTFEQRLEAGIRTNARSRMTEDARRGFEKFVNR